MKPFLLTLFAMLAFAANSILCRMALGSELIDAASFTSVRLISGALTLSIILLLRKTSLQHPHFDIRAVVALFLYAICFSFSYLDLGAGTGALILFGTVQLTMIAAGLLHGDRPGLFAWLGIMLASSGLVYLVFPGVSAPSTKGTVLMTIAGLAWGIYSLRGRLVKDAIAATSWNFIGTVPLTIATSLFFADAVELQNSGVALAVLSGALASGLGYVIWYAALPYLKPTSAASVQLSVPLIAALGGVIFMAEPFTLRLTIAGMTILGGIGIVIHTNRRLSPQK